MLYSPCALLIQQDFPGLERRALRQHAALVGIDVVNAPLAALGEHVDALRKGAILPVGSVEFVREAMALAGVQEPSNISYPMSLRSYLGRDVQRCRIAGNVMETLPARCFVKPVQTKAFTGFVFDAHTSQGDACSLSQCEALSSMKTGDELWLCEIVRWTTEVRCYVAHGRLLGAGRYDSGPEDWPDPDPSVIESMIDDFSDAPAAYTLDVGVLASGETALVECNDAWAIGYYKGSLRPSDYHAMLQARWMELIFNA